MTRDHRRSPSRSRRGRPPSLRHGRAAHALAPLLLVFAGAPDPVAAGMTITKGAQGLAEVNGVVRYGGRPFSGIVVEREGDHVLSRTRYRDGEADGLAEGFYPDGRCRYQKLFRRGRREGTHRGFWPSGEVQFVHRYEHDLLEGEQAAFFEDGAPAELRHYRDGREEGQQRFYDRKGTVIANYTFVNGRRYGIVGRFDCISVGHP
jgi:antitoxin component YwqK of YwqJK toxin-antitoxin module